MKFRIFFHTVGSPLMLATAFLWPPVDRLSVRLFLMIAITAALLISLFFNRKKYLRHLKMDAGKICLEFVSAPLVDKSLSIDFSELEDLRLSPDGFRYEAAGVLHMKRGGKWQSFIILNKKTYGAVQLSLAAAGLHPGKAGLVRTA